MIRIWSYWPKTPSRARLWLQRERRSGSGGGCLHGENRGMNNITTPANATSPARPSTTRPGPDRLPPIAAADWTPAQRERAEAIINGPRGALVSPFVPLLRSPELMDHVQRLGEYLRYRSAIGQHLSELAILVTARAWSQPVEWAIHAPIAEREGLSAAAIEAIADGREPADLSADEALVYAFSRELQATQQVADATWQAVVARFGEAATVDLVAVNGYYTLLSMVMNAARTPAPPSAAVALTDGRPAWMPGSGPAGGDA